MKITATQLRRIIAEEIKKTMNEATGIDEPDEVDYELEERNQAELSAVMDELINVAKKIGSNKAWVMRMLRDRVDFR